ncbi:MAG: sulfurtransferase-like selenium metabolism protein YedF, partial [Candidatus Cloacimonadota bacterium]|nr:sulfurtransferase-like selenium metabolism protein YedF [Candidatus Cloacimonadota bacterium]
MKKLVDGRGLACPQPVIKTKDALENENFSELEVIVDNKPASQNVKRFAENTGNTVTNIQEKNGFFHVTIQPGIDANSKIDVKQEKINCPESKIILISSNKLGKGNNQLGELLMTSFIYTLTELKCKPKKIIFMNSGVKLTVENSQALD